MPTSERLIGYYVLTEPTTFTRTYETASWYTKIEVPAGEYPIYAGECKRPDTGEIQLGLDWPSAPHARLDGVVTSSYFVNRVFWATSSETDRDVGKPDAYGWSTYGYAVAQAVLNGDPHFRLLPDVEAREVRFEYNGEPRVTHGLFVKAEA